ncbi:MAG: DUF2934 domain-containing protein [Methanoculleus bourgensis]|uniref:DUF2934 domain-containing protein n=1 Tax=Methanoculleus bourgensis TaxID=83986 RepID=A0A8T7HCY9_9EURY|nr:DUF2934 domain-containing protein [Methanoculleus bourgensis]
MPGCPPGRHAQHWSRTR